MPAGASIGPEATVGPFSYLRPGTRLARGARSGLRRDQERRGRRRLEGAAPVLRRRRRPSARANIGAATIFVNYDGVAKHHTTVGDHVRIGSDTMLVAPVTVGDGAYTAAGSVITEDVPPGRWPSRGRRSGMWQAGWRAPPDPGGGRGSASRGGAPRTGTRLRAGTDRCRDQSRDDDR